MKTIILILYFLAGLTSHPPREYSDVKSTDAWKLVKEKNEIEVYQQWITFENGKKTRRLKGCFQVEAASARLVNFLSKAENNTNWLSGATESKNLNLLNNEWISYTRFNLPWPFNDQDLIANNKVHAQENETIIKIASRPLDLPEYKNVIRIKQFEGHWKFITISKTKTKVEYSVYSVTKPVAPRFIQDPVVIQSFYNSLKNFKNQTSENETQQS